MVGVSNPALWAGVPGQRHAVEFLAAAARQPVHAYLFVGPAGTGKEQAARAFAAALLCRRGGCADCRDCRLALAGNHPDLREVERSGAAISAEQAGDIVHRAALAPVEGARKVLVLHEFHLLRPEAAVRLLKTIEEPASSTVFLVLADDVPPQLATIASRCVRVEFHGLDPTAIALVLETDGVAPEPALAAARLAGGSLATARLLAADPQASVRRAAFAGLAHRLDGTGATVAAIVDELLGLVEASLAPLRAQQAAEIAELQERMARVGQRGSARKALEDEHKRQLRRARTDELRAGLSALAGSYRDTLGAAHGDTRTAAVAERLAAVAAIGEAIRFLDRNVNETLLLQSLLLRLPALP